MMHCGYFATTRNAHHSSLPTPTLMVGDAPFLSNIRRKWPTPFEKRRLREIPAHNVSIVRDSEKSSITTNIKSTTGFPTSYRWSAYVSLKSRKNGSKSDFLYIFGIKVNFNRTKSGTKFLCVKIFSRKVVARLFSYLMIHRYWREK